MANGEASVWLPHALDRKYPSAHAEFKWQFLFASARFSRDPKTGERHRHHLHSDTFPVHLKNAVNRAQINKHVTSHTFRHSFATHLLQDLTDIRTIQELLGHSDITTTMIYTNVLARPDIRVVSPLDRLEMPEVKKVPEVQELGQSGVSALGTVIEREMDPNKQTNRKITISAVRIDSDVSLIAQKSRPTGNPPTNANATKNTMRPGSVRSAIDPPESAPVIAPQRAQAGTIRGAKVSVVRLKRVSVISVFDFKHGNAGRNPARKDDG